MAGRISDGEQLVVPTHATALVERHEISVEHSGPIADLHVAGLLEVCTRAALNWGEEIGASVGQLTCFGDHGTVGVRFELTIGRTDPADGARDDQGNVPWRWSGRWTYWADKLVALRRASAPLRQAPPDGDAEIIDMAWARFHRDNIAGV